MAKIIFYCFIFTLMFIIPLRSNTIINGTCAVNIDIPDDECIDIDIAVSGIAGELGTDIYLKSVKLIIEHTWTADLDIELKSPDNQIIILSSDNGSAGDHYGDPNSSCDSYTEFVSNYDFDNCNTGAIFLSQAPFIGQFLPEQNLSTFNSGSPNGDWELEICDDAEFSIGKLIYVELVFDQIDCIIPSDLSPNLVSFDNFFLQWSGSPNCPNTVIEYGPNGFNLGSGTTINATCSPAHITGLAASSTFDFYIKSYCALSSSFSEISCPLTVTTPCNPGTPTITTIFDTLNQCIPSCTEDCDFTGVWFNSKADDIDWLVKKGATPSNNTGPTVDADQNPDGKYIYLESSCPTGTNGWKAQLLSSCIFVQPSIDGCHMSFAYNLHGVDIGPLFLQIQSNNNAWQNIWQISGSGLDRWINTFIDLTSFEGQVIQMRFISQVNNSNLGDIALDNIRFYGSILHSLPQYTYYRDQDGDGYGTTEAFFESCMDTAPTGFTSVVGDCDDNNPFINPNASEFPCDGFDQNCNSSDDNLLPPPSQVLGDEVCSGVQGILYALPVHFGKMYWYDNPTGGQALDSMDNYLPVIVNNTTNNIIEKHYYVEEQNSFGCVSSLRTQVTLTTYPVPYSDQIHSFSICLGDSIDLSSFQFEDQHQTQHVLSYHSGLPATETNELQSSVVAPTQNESFYIKASTIHGCSDVISVSIGIKPVPQFEILAANPMCVNTSQILEVVSSSPLLEPYAYQWNLGSTEFQQEYFATHANATIEAIVKVTGSNLCIDRDTVTIEVNDGLQPISISTQDVSSCQGNNGSISLNIETGVPPFNIYYSGPSSGQITSQVNYAVITGLTQGGYHISILDSSGGNQCSIDLPLTLVNGPNAIYAIDEINHAKCHDSTDGSIDLFVFAPNATFNWSNGAMTEDISGLTPGVYSVTINTDQCQSVIEDIEIQAPAPMDIIGFEIKPTSCYAGNDGEIHVNIQGGIEPYELNWSDNLPQSTNLFNLEAGSYTLTVMDANLCIQVSQEYLVNNPSIISSQFTKKDISCHRAKDGNIEVDIIGGTPPYNFLWNDGVSIQNRNNLDTGWYHLRVTDLNQCIFNSDSIFVSQPDSLSILNSFSQNPSCYGLENGIVGVVISGGTSPLEYLWSTGATSPSINSLGPGTYTIKIEDDNECVILDSVLLTAPVNVDALFTIDNTSCLGITDGRIAVDENMTQGVGPYTYSWSNNETGPEIDQLETGQYFVTTIDNTNCISIDTIDVGYFQPIQFTSLINEPNCHNSQTGSIDLNVFGGVEDYQFLWSNGSINSKIEGITSDYYSVTISDAIGCQRHIDSIFVDEPEPIVFDLISIDSVVCAGSYSGNIELNVMGGRQPYNFTWNGEGSLTEDNYNLAAGNYVLQVTDQNNCSLESPIYSVGQAEPLSITDNIFDTDVSNCFSEAIDSLVIEVMGGASPYIYQWDDGNTEDVRYYLQPGEYCLTVTDGLGCIQEHCAKIYDEIRQLEVEVLDTVILDNCNTLFPEFCMSIEGGVEPYTFLWNDANTGTVQNTTICRELSSNINSVTITDSNECFFVLDNLQSDFTQPLSIFTQSNHISQIDCYGANNGSINPQISGGHSPFSYSWIDGSNSLISIDSFVEGLIPGTYYLTVTDAANCTSTNNWIITQPDQELDYTAQLSHVDCYGDSTGSIDITVVGGTPPYDYLWSNNQTNQDLINIPALAYSITITDNNHCLRIIPNSFLTVTQPSQALQIIELSSLDISCYDVEDGFAAIQVIGGSPPYNFDWSTPFSPDHDSIFNLGPGIHTCNIVDENACLIQSPEFEILEPEELEAQVTIVNHQNGAVQISIIGGTPHPETNTYDILWPNNATHLTTVGIEPGFHTVEVTDFNGCMISVPFTIDEVSSFNSINNINTLAIYPNPSNGNFVISGISSEINLKGGFLSLYSNIGQKLVQRIDLFNNVQEVDFSIFPQGTYFLVYSNQGKVLSTKTFTIVK